jgi:cell division protein FtsI (penicillin-binding protein 3)
MAGSVFGKIAERVYAKNLVLNLAAANDTIESHTPQVMRGEVSDAKHVLEELDTYAPLDHYEVTSSDAQTDYMPSVLGMGAKDAVYLLEQKGLKVQLTGVGKAIRQSIPQGASIKRGQGVLIELNM